MNLFTPPHIPRRFKWFNKSCWRNWKWAIPRLHATALKETVNIIHLTNIVNFLLTDVLNREKEETELFFMSRVGKYLGHVLAYLHSTWCSYKSDTSFWQWLDLRSNNLKLFLCRGDVKSCAWLKNIKLIKMHIKIAKGLLRQLSPLTSLSA